MQATTGDYSAGADQQPQFAATINFTTSTPPGGSSDLIIIAGNTSLDFLDFSHNHTLCDFKDILYTTTYPILSQVLLYFCTACIITTVALNALVLAVLTVYWPAVRRLRSSGASSMRPVREAAGRAQQEMYIANLACCDLFVGLILFPMWLLETIVYGCWTFPLWACRWRKILSWVLGFESGITVGLIALDRLMMVRLGPMYAQHETRTRVCLKILASWVAGTFFFIPLGYYDHIVSGITLSVNGFCFSEFMQHWQLFWIVYYIYYSVPVLFCVCTYVQIFIILNLRRRRQREGAHQQHKHCRPRDNNSLLKEKNRHSSSMSSSHTTLTGSSAPAPAQPHSQNYIPKEEKKRKFFSPKFLSSSNSHQLQQQKNAGVAPRVEENIFMAVITTADDDHGTAAADNYNELHHAGSLSVSLAAPPSASATSRSCSHYYAAPGVVDAQKRRYRKAWITMIFLNIVFAMWWLPHWIVSIVELFMKSLAEPSQQTRASFVLHDIKLGIEIIYYLNALLNPCIYLTTIPSLRLAVVKIVKRLVCCQWAALLLTRDRVSLMLTEAPLSVAGREGRSGVVINDRDSAFPPDTPPDGDVDEDEDDDENDVVVGIMAAHTPPTDADDNTDDEEFPSQQQRSTFFPPSKKRCMTMPSSTTRHRENVIMKNQAVNRRRTTTERRASSDFPEEKQQQRVQSLVKVYDTSSTAVNGGVVSPFNAATVRSSTPINSSSVVHPAATAPTTSGGVHSRRASSSRGSSSNRGSDGNVVVVVRSNNNNLEGADGVVDDENKCLLHQTLI